MQPTPKSCPTRETMRSQAQALATGQANILRYAAIKQQSLAPRTFQACAPHQRHSFLACFCTCGMSLGCLFAWLTGGLAFPSTCLCCWATKQPKNRIWTALLQHWIWQRRSHHVPGQEHCLSQGAGVLFCLWSSLLTGWLFRAGGTWPAVIAGGVPLIHLPHHLGRARGALLRHRRLQHLAVGVAAELEAHLGRPGCTCTRAARRASDAMQHVSDPISASQHCVLSREKLATSQAHPTCSPKHCWGYRNHV